MEVPQVVFCTKFPFKTDMMTEMGFREKFLLVKPHTYLENKNITDLNDVWENGTYSMDELSIGWLVMYGNVGSGKVGREREGNVRYHVRSSKAW